MVSHREVVQSSRGRVSLAKKQLEKVVKAGRAGGGEAVQGRWGQIFAVGSWVRQGTGVVRAKVLRTGDGSCFLSTTSPVPAPSKSSTEWKRTPCGLNCG
jgi:hypothetical protein